jgi:hypothetical protein
VDYHPIVGRIGGVNDQGSDTRKRENRSGNREDEALTSRNSSAKLHLLEGCDVPFGRRRLLRMASFPTRSATRPENGAIRGCRDVLRRRLDR